MTAAWLYTVNEQGRAGVAGTEVATETAEIVK